ncbi:hypothetical protein KUG02_09515 [Streptococcus equi subsp. zooepidemicus]|uniref:Uncharacterized protein n=1 Tax=Streptococcus equi subsp. zooepidemicus TaxID=40041 RepID=A0AAJ1USK1_STRSZ|nr:hypothetical protein [Streptococcus equi]MCD3386923.1 hypothetical protein [Streptococcus equi subsp. zooepidemicus]MCD3390899.1 hypothetical protein [Streptococcus equi subsp. zooepidemicus]MCD3417815.1 hypothetical protein [Streptococcus equi subsp. zooepidemicus]MCD3422927.1 hypothetical protein [Streptococcus equi subsp. zooepidemicus]MCD3433929.1 hypothetical protein [Streptococcus equi subsp. zooepidemicus]
MEQETQYLNNVIDSLINQLASKCIEQAELVANYKKLSIKKTGLEKENKELKDLLDKKTKGE